MTLLLSSLVSVFFIAAPQPDCRDWQDCRDQALAAAAREDYELFHDLAWRAVQKGPKNEAALMTLLARAQSLSGRPHDALVMLDRLTALGVVTDAAEHEDFRRVRALPGWVDLQARIAELGERPEGASPGTRSGAAPSTPAAVSPATPPPAASPGKPAPVGATSGGDSAGTGATDALRFETDAFTPIGLAYDAVSSRFIVGDLKDRKLSVIGERSGRMFTLIGAESGGFGEIGGLAIDAREGDLWVASTSGNDLTGARLHRLQLISGRQLFSEAVPPGGSPARFTDLAITPQHAVLALDGLGRRIFRSGRNGLSHTTGLQPAATLNVSAPASIAPASDSVVYVAHADGIIRLDLQSGAATNVKPGSGVNLGALSCIRWHRGALVAVQKTDDDTYRIVRVRLNGNGSTATRVDVLQSSVAMPSPSSIVVSSDVLFYLTTSAEQSDVAQYLVRRISLK